MRPVLFSFFQFEMRSAAAFAGLSALAAFLYFRTRRRDMRLSLEELWGLVLSMMVGVFLGGPIAHLALYGPGFFHNLERTWQARRLLGGSFFGVFLGATLAALLYCRRRGLGFWAVADALGAAGFLGLAVMRVGCLLNGCCYGLETDIFCAIVYTNPASNGPVGIPVHPTQIYEIIYNLIVFVVLLLLRGRFRPDGSLFLIYLTLYSLWRFGIDFIREGTPFLFGLHEAQVISIIVLVIAVTRLALRTRRVSQGEAS